MISYQKYFPFLIFFLVYPILYPSFFFHFFAALNWLLKHKVSDGAVSAFCERPSVLDIYVEAEHLVWVGGGVICNGLRM